MCDNGRMAQRPRDPNERAFQIVSEGTGQAPRLEHEESPLAARASKGGQGRAGALTPARRREIAKAAAEVRWGLARSRPERDD